METPQHSALVPCAVGPAEAAFPRVLYRSIVQITDSVSQESITAIRIFGTASLPEMVYERGKQTQSRGRRGICSYGGLKVPAEGALHSIPFAKSSPNFRKRMVTRP